jgi:hypothetical protein
VGLVFAWAFAFACHVHAQGKHYQANAQVRVLFLKRLLEGNIALYRVLNRQALCV